ncbi:MAG: glycine cleavage system protein H [Deltaproteobacteria bacterium]
MSEEMLKVTVDKFTFLVPTDRLFSDAGVWAKLEGNRVRLGLSDYLQQSSGDVAFAKVKAVGTRVGRDDDFADIETVKVDVSVPSPLPGTIMEINPALAEASEIINQDPYGKGWLAIIEPADWEADRVQLLGPSAYLALVKGQAEAEMKK